MSKPVRVCRVDSSDVKIRELAGTNVNARRGDDAAALHQAAIDGHETIAHFLVAQGADLTLRDKNFNGTPAGWARAGGFTELAAKLEAFTGY